jgi:hypothetical protein
MIKLRDRKDIFYILYILIIVVMAVIYFTMPERASFIDHQLKWWGEFFKPYNG